ncbi:hypothetical protein AA0116_g13302 [Alternaria tenuissima]|nr:hypothetical protein AA0116_g13302 [Alternaria tenuissima]
MPSYYKPLLNAIELRHADDVRRHLMQMSPDQKKRLSKKRKSLLDEAASGRQNKVMAILIDHRVTKWVGSHENNQVFIRLIEDYIEDGGIDKESNATKHKLRMDVLSNRGDLAKTTNAIQILLQSQGRWLVSKLQGTALVRNTSTHIGDNISWDIRDGVENTFDRATGRRIRLDQVLFGKPQRLVLSGTLLSKEEEWIVNIEGTTREVLEKIYQEYELMLKESPRSLYFEGLRLDSKRKYFLELGS